jgi:hypothetical protein
MLVQRPRHIGFLVIVTALFATSSAYAQSSPATPEGEPPAAYVESPDDAPLTEVEEVEAEDDSPRRERAKIQAVGLGYRAILFRTQANERFAVHGPSVVYDYFVGRRWGFAIHGEASFPLTGRYAGPDNFRGSIREIYESRHYSFDLAFMAAYRLDFSDKLAFFGAAGLHAQTLVLDSASKLPVQLISMGFALTGRIQWNFHPHVFLSTNFMVGFDPFDMIDHQNEATIAIPLSGALSPGFQY